MPEGSSASEIKFQAMVIKEARMEQQDRKTIAHAAAEAARISGGEPIDPVTRFEYSFHASTGKGFDSVRENGLRARPNAKERNTVWFNDWNHRDFYEPHDDKFVLYRVKNTDLREIDPSYDWDWSERWDGPANIEGEVPPKIIDYSEDNGLSWKPLVPPENKT